MHLSKQLRITAIDTATHKVTMELPTAAPAPDSVNSLAFFRACAGKCNCTILFNVDIDLPERVDTSHRLDRAHQTLWALTGSGDPAGLLAAVREIFPEDSLDPANPSRAWAPVSR
jgi:hypothetical protein